MAGLISYVKKAFKNYPDTTTRLSAENLNHLDNGIFDLDQAVGNALGTTDISSVGDGTIKGAISILNTSTNQLNNDIDDLKNINVHSTTPVVVGTDINGKPIYRKVYTGASLLNGQVIDSALNSNTVKWFTVTGCFAGVGNELNHIPYISSNYMCNIRISSNGMNAQVSNITTTSYYIIVDYVLI